MFGFEEVINEDVKIYGGFFQDLQGGRGLV